MQDQKTVFAENLRHLCRRKRSVSLVCREIGINRQQFDKYLNGTSLPSGHNLRRICGYFDVDESRIFEPPNQFHQQHAALDGQSGGNPLAILMEMFPGNRTALRGYLGLYHNYFLSPTWPDRIQKSVSLLFEEDGYIQSRYLARLRDPDHNILYRSRFNGVAAYQGERIIILERSARDGDSLAQTVLLPTHHSGTSYLTGMCFGLVWRPDRRPFSSRMIWKPLRKTGDLREALASCGLIRRDDRHLDPVVRSFFRQGD